MNRLPVLIVGAGFAGLSAARLLLEHQISGLILEKSRGLGGRAATRRIGSQPVDFGAQFFTVRSEEFARKVREWEAVGLCRPWARGFASWPEPCAASQHDRYCTPLGITSIAKYEADGLQVLRESRVERIERSGELFQVFTEGGQSFLAERVLLTAPAPQALALAAPLVAPLAATELEALEYSPCFSLIVRLPGFAPSWPALQCRHSVLEWVAFDDSRRQSQGESLFVLHSTGGFAQAFFERRPPEVSRPMLEAASEITGADFTQAPIEHFHRWKFARVENPLPLPRFRALDAQGRLLFAGDAFGDPKLESAWLAGRAAAQAFLAS